MTNDSDDPTGSLDSSIDRNLVSALGAAQSEHAGAQLALRDAVCAFLDRLRSLGHSLDDSVSAVRAAARLARRKGPTDAHDVALANRQLEVMIQWCIAERSA